jgi:arginyl-tRNA synthetase
MTIDFKINQAIAQGMQALFNIELDANDIALQPTRKEFEGSHTFVSFPYVKQTRKSPEETGRLLGEYLLANYNWFHSFNVVKGFLNLSLSPLVWVQTLSDILATSDYGFSAPNSKRVMVEYSSPNTNKPLHLGHLRNNFLGYSISRIMQANGYSVDKVNLVNDRGIHICKSMIAYELFGNQETPQSSGLKGDHLAGKYYVMFETEFRKQIAKLVAEGLSEDEAKKQAPIMLSAKEMLLKWEENDPKVIDLWKKMNGWVYEGFNATYTKMGVEFDKYYYESDTYLLGKDIVEEGLEKGVFYRKENGSVWVDLTGDGLDEKLVLRADGTSVYMTQDLGTADMKYREFKPDKSIYVVGNEQDYHFQVLFLIMKKLGRPFADGLFHLSYGMVDLPSGKMKSREGTVVDADDLMDEMIETAARHTQELGKVEGFSEAEAQELYRKIGLGALKFFLLRVDPKKRILFNPEESVEFQGFTAPFIQYTFARIASLLRRGEQISKLPDAVTVANYTALNAEELDVIHTLNEFPSKIQLAGKEFDPSAIAQYIYELAKAYNRFYTEHSIFNSDQEETIVFRISLSFAVAETIKRGMWLLGIEVPERM